MKRSSPPDPLGRAAHEAGPGPQRLGKAPHRHAEAGASIIPASLRLSPMAIGAKGSAEAELRATPAPAFRRVMERVRRLAADPGP